MDVSNAPANAKQIGVSEALNSISKAKAAIAQALSDGRSAAQNAERLVAQSQVGVELGAAQDVLRKLISSFAPISDADTTTLRAALLAIDDAESQIELAFGDRLDRARSEARSQLRGLLSDAERELSNEILRGREEAEALEKIAAGLAKRSAE